MSCCGGLSKFHPLQNTPCHSLCSQDSDDVQRQKDLEYSGKQRKDAELQATEDEQDKLNTKYLLCLLCLALCCFLPFGIVATIFIVQVS